MTTSATPKCFVCDADVSSWLMDPDQPDGPRIFAIHVCKPRKAEKELTTRD